jgi:NADPH:quinone reductase-like Zn-dependent oxidoreductase
VHGGGSGVGTFAIQYATAVGARVLTTARVAKHEALTSLGADRVIDYENEDFVTVTREATAGRGADVILDIMGAPYLSRNLDALAPDGRLVIIGLQGGRRAELDLATLMAIRGTIGGTTLRARSLPDKARIVRAVHQQIWPLISSGSIVPVIDRRLPMPQAAEAHRFVDESRHIGKVLLLAPRS